MGKNHSKRAYLWVLIVLLPLAALGIFAALKVHAHDSAANAYNKQDHVVNVNHCITDAAGLKKAFPAFGNILSCRWDTGIMHKDTFLESICDIGPSQYWLNGYAVLDQKEIDRLMKDYTWESDSDNLCGHFEKIVKQIKADKKFDWKQSEDLNNSFGGFFGNFYLDENNGIILFDLIKD